MVHEIRGIRDKLVSEVEREITERGIDRIDSKSLGETIDMIKDLAVAEEKCRKAEYYRLVSEAMSGGDADRMPTRHPEIADAISRAMQSADPHEREEIKGEVLSMLA